MADAGLLTRIDGAVDASFPAALRTLERLVNTDSYARVPETVNAIYPILTPLLERAGCRIEVRRQSEYGDHFIAVLPGNRPGRILLLGHVDVAHPPGTAARRPFTLRDGRLWGPGVSDMKGGVVSIVYAVAALREAGWDDRPDVEVLLTPDEEIGSPSSRAVIEERSRGAIAVFNLESGRPDGSVVVARKGSAHLEIEVEGRAAHSGVWIERGVSAVGEMAHKTVALHALTDLPSGRTVNVGVFEGGTNTNVVAARAVAKVHLGFWTLADYEALLARVREIVERRFVPGTRSVLRGGISFLPMERHAGVERLLRVVQEAGRGIGLDVKGTATPGAADSGFPAALGVPTICGMGPVGGGWHGEDEYAELDTYPARIKLLARSVVLAAERLGAGAAA